MKPTHVIGIDPGLTGAIAVVSGGVYPSRPDMVVDMPVSAKATGKGQEVSAAHLYAALNGLLTQYGPLPVFLERVSAMPGQGVTSVFSFGRSLGVIEGVIGSLGLPLHLVTPAVWKKSLGLLRKDKDATRTWASQVYPTLAAERLARKKDIGRADALAIAHYGLSTIK